MTDLTLEQKLRLLRDCIELGDADRVQEVIFALGAIHNGWTVPDEVVKGLLTLLRDEKMFTSPFAGHVLNFFEFESLYLTPRQKSLCTGFLSAHGNRFTDVHSQQVVTELRYDNYLK